MPIIEIMRIISGGPPYVPIIEMMRIISGAITDNDEDNIRGATHLQQISLTVTHLICSSSGPDLTFGDDHYVKVIYER